MNLSLFLLAAPASLRVSTLWQALPLSGFSFVGGIKVKFCLILSLGWVIGSFPFPCLRGIFLFKEGLCSSPEIPGGFQGWRWKKNFSYCSEGFCPLSITRQETKYSNSFWKNKCWLSAEHELGFINQETTSNSMRLTQTITHACTHTLC